MKSFDLLTGKILQESFEKCTKNIKQIFNGKWRNDSPNESFRITVLSTVLTYAATLINQNDILNVSVLFSLQSSVVRCL